MKRILLVLLALTMLLSLSSVGFANAYINYTYMDEITGFTYHFGRFDEGATDAGLMVNGYKRSLTGGNYEGTYANAFAQADANSNLFGIGIKPADSYEGTTYTAAPYATVNGVDVVGQEVTYSTEEYTNLLKDVVLNDVVVADVIGGSSAIDYENYASSNSNCSIRTYGNGSAYNQLYSLLVKLDLTKIPEDVKALTNSNYVLTLTGSFANWTMPTSGAIEGPEKELADQYKANVPGLKINAYAAPDAGDWTETNAPVIMNGTSSTAYYYIAYGPKAENPILLDSVEVPSSATSDAEYGFNLTSLIQSAIAEGKDYATVCFCLDETYANKIHEETNGIVRIRQVFTLRPNEEKAMKLTCQAEDDSLAITNIKVGEVNYDPSTLANNTLTLDIPAMDTSKWTQYIPVVSAEASSSSATLNITQATVENPVATVTMSYAGNVKESYTINFNIPSISEVTRKSVRDHLTNANNANRVSVGSWADIGATRTLNKSNSIAFANKNLSSTLNDNKKIPVSMGLLKIDLTAIADNFDRTKPVFLFGNAGEANYSPNPTISTAQVVTTSIYDATDVFPGGIDSVTATDIHFVEENNNTSKIAQVVTDANRVATTTYGTDATLVYWDISDLVAEYKDAGKNECIIAFFIDNWSGNTNAAYDCAYSTLYVQNYFSSEVQYFVAD